MKNVDIAAGLIVERLTVIGPAEKPRHWRCVCACGAEKVVYAGNLGANTFSCGCFIREKRRKHGSTGNAEYRAWRHILDRCLSRRSQEWHNYGARGITVCAEWRRDFGAFFDHVGSRPSADHEIDRIDNGGNYEPGNVRWATKKENCRNTRRNRMVEFHGRRMTLAEAIEMSSVNAKTVRVRIFKGWDAERALTETAHTQGAGTDARAA